ncbi:glyoxylate/hydroxypyruvate reductase A [Umezawaea sp.]|uniref:2-hydroxyacid dehydrogenase n=1 Tax=Umezawaea sp. TaxID=1955258 RepID=UPI002ED65A11
MHVLLLAEGEPVEWWRDALRADLPDAVLVCPENGFDESAVDYALVWDPPEGALARLDNLRLVFSLGAGVEHVLRDRSYPRHVPLVRVVDERLTRQMCEYVAFHVLGILRRHAEFALFQRSRVWRSETPHTACDLRVGIMGLGVLGRAVAKTLRQLEFQVAGWSRTRHKLSDVDCYAGEEELAEFLGRTDVLVCLLPLTPRTTAMVDFALLDRLARDGVLDAPAFIGAGRGKVHVERDLLRALDAGVLSHAVLDVFETEPLPSDSPLWSNAAVTITPHCAAVADPRDMLRQVVAAIEDDRRGRPLRHVVDVDLGY